MLKGWVKNKSPAPNMSHQRISMNIAGTIWKFMQNKPRQIFTAPFDVRLSGTVKSKNTTEPETIYTVVQPDISVICDVSKLDEKGCMGAPDGIIEIVSPGNTKKEIDDKFDLYQENGVKKYWIVQPTDETVTVFDLIGTAYQFKKIYNNVDNAPVGIFADFKIDLKEVFKK